MHISKKFLLAILVLALTIIACGSTSNIIVKTPESEEIEEETAENQDEVEPQIEPTKTAGPTETKQVGTARSNPAPVGSEVIADDMSFIVIGITRPATNIIMAGNMFNEEPEAGEEYIFIEMEITCLVSMDEVCSFNPMFTVTMIGSAGIEHDSEWMVAGVDGLLESTEFYGGATISGSIPFIISQDETDLILLYEPLFGDTFYLEIPENYYQGNNP